MPTFTHQNTEIHYIDHGVGQPLIFQHGLGGDLSQALESADSLHGVRLIAMDARAHGKSALGDPQQLSFASMAGDLIALLGHLQIDQAVIGGISMGAGISLCTALNYPQHVKGLILVRPAWLDQPSPANLQVLGMVGKTLRTYGAQEGKQVFARSDLYTRLQTTAPAAAESTLAQFEEPRAEECAARLERIPADAPNRNRAEWARIRIPTLVVATRVDPVHPFEYAQALAEGIPTATLVEITPKSVDKEHYLQELGAQLQAFMQQFK